MFSIYSCDECNSEWWSRKSNLQIKFYCFNCRLKKSRISIAHKALWFANKNSLKIRRQDDVFKKYHCIKCHSDWFSKDTMRLSRFICCNGFNSSK